MTLVVIKKIFRFRFGSRFQKTWNRRALFVMQGPLELNFDWLVQTDRQTDKLYAFFNRRIPFLSEMEIITRNLHDKLFRVPNPVCPVNQKIIKFLFCSRT